MSFEQIFRLLWARRALILIATVLALFAATIAGMVLPPRYQAHARVMLNLVKPDPITGESISSQFARAYVRTQTELIRDYRIAGKVVDILGWASSPDLAEQYANRRSDDVRDFRRWMAQRVIDSTNAELIEGSNILDISYTAPSPQGASAVAEAIRRAYIEQAIAFRREDASRDAEWFRLQSAKIKEELAAAEQRKSAFERANGIVLDDQDIDQDQRRLTALAIAQPAQASGQAISVGANPAAAQIAQLDAAIGTAERTLGPNNPQLLDMKRQREALASTAGSAQVVSAGPSGPSVGAQYNAQLQKVLAQRGKTDEARRLSVEVAVLRDQFQKASMRVAELEQQSQSIESGLTLLGAATAPNKPSFPNWPLIIFGSLGLGLMLGVLAALIAELLARRVRCTADLRFGELPVLGEMAVPARSGGWKLLSFGRKPQTSEVMAHG
ncbi:Wzz/FepE/Etk N-terminal domain-containing protein [Novosphingobium ginsenosidimutans]|uniref:Chain length determinant protein n=1 Tax=Novosphingobium ginsenosidimutans TaxID=1176536 RepID=A0A5B8S8I0_9SPHN|nr:Wzz/FepE/Etk N-terminal domain-containing protein [Novosphingobium ginsenosidimutans]QEA17220.1 chain length determinant protein [Novosphingobium ginsenosidimutans]